jgi:short-subunit dehydrogenase
MIYTLITGASKGIGRALAEECARRKMNLILVARSAAELDELSQSLQSTHDIKIHTYQADLCRPDAAKGLANFCVRHQYAVNIVINNAGNGFWGKFSELKLEDQMSCVNLNVSAVVSLTHSFLPLLKKQKRGYILNVASIAGFLPMPYFSIYAATKAFVVSFSRGIRHELKKESISVSCLCPGPTETGFVASAGMKDFRFNKNSLFMKSADVAKIGIDGMLRGREIIVPGASNKLSAVMSGAIPKKILSKIMGAIYKP